VYRKLRSVRLKSGEKGTLGVIRTPDLRHRKAILSYYTPSAIEKEWGSTKDDWRLQHVTWFCLKSLSGSLDDLEILIYVLKVRSEIVGKVMIARHAGFAVAGNMVTKAEYRGKGLQSILAGELMKDFRSLGGIVIAAAAPQKGSYHLGVKEGYKTDGALMVFESSPTIRSEMFRQGLVTARPLKWNDYPSLVVHALREDGCFFRSYFLEQYGPSYMEHSFLKLKLLSEREQAVCHVLETEHKAIVGFATLVEDPKWKFQNWIFDVDVHPSFEENADKLIRSFSFPKGKIQCFLDGNSKKKEEALRACGFEHEATLSKHIMRENNRLDLLAYAKIV
jgi:hypothetical protein